MGYDDVISHIGEFGQYQRRIYFLLCLPAISCAFHKMGGVFLAAKSDFRCLLPRENPENATFLMPPDLANISFPWDTNTEHFSQCERYSIEIPLGHNTSGGNLSSPRSTVKCHSFVYDKSEFSLTITTEWDLVCDNAWLRATSDSVFMVGIMLGSTIFGGLSDRYGRKLTFFLAMIGQLVGGILVAISPGIVTYLISRMIIGSTSTGVFLVAYVIALEMVGPRKRLMASTGCQLFWTLGYIFTGGLAYFITNWRSLQIAFTIPSVAFLTYWWFIPESGRWLLKEGRIEEVKGLMKKASSENGVELSSDTLDILLNNDVQSKPSDSGQSSVFDLLKYPNLRRKCLLLSLVWIVNSGTYYGLSWNTSDLGGDNHINFLIAAAVEVPAHLFQFLTLDRWGRKIIVCGCMLFAGTSLLCTLLIPDDMQWMIIVLAMFGKFAITASYDAVNIFTAEQFPTVIRNSALGACSTFAKLGGIVVPYIYHLGEFWTPFPLVILGSSSLITGFLPLLLPETLNTNLPETIEDGERFGKMILREIDQSNDVTIIQPLTAVPEPEVFQKEEE